MQRASAFVRSSWWCLVPAAVLLLFANGANAMDTTGLPPDESADDVAGDADAMDQSRGKRKKEAPKVEPADEAALLAANLAGKAAAPVATAATTAATATDGSAGGGGPRL